MVRVCGVVTGSVRVHYAVVLFAGDLGAGQAAWIGGVDVCVGGNAGDERHVHVLYKVCVLCISDVYSARGISGAGGLAVVAMGCGGYFCSLASCFGVAVRQFQLGGVVGKAKS